MKSLEIITDDFDNEEDDMNEMESKIKPVQEGVKKKPVATPKV